MNKNKGVLSPKEAVFIAACVLFFIVIFASYSGYALLQRTAAVNELEKKLGFERFFFDNYFVQKYSEAAIFIASDDGVTGFLSGVMDGNGAVYLINKMKEAYGASYVYIMDSNGDVKASTELDGVSLLGKNYRFRPYFLDAMDKGAAIYSAVGVTTFTRGIYFSSAVFKGAKPVGVAVMKIGMDEIDIRFKESGLELALVSPEGIIFSSGNNKWILRHILPDKKAFKADEQFAGMTVESAGLVKKGRYYMLGNKKYIMRKTKTAISGFELVVFAAVSDLGRTGHIHAGTFFIFVAVLLLFAAAIIGLIYLIYRQREAENKEKQAREEIKDILRITSESFIQLDNNMSIVRINPAVTQLLKTDEKNILGKPLTHFLDTENVSVFRRNFEGRLSGKSGRYELAFMAKDGSKTDCLINAAPLFDEQNRFAGSFAFVTDINDRKEAERELKENIEAKLQFISIVSHELRTPLTGMKEGIGLVLEEECGPLNSEQKSFLGLAKRNVDRLHRLINNVLDYQRLSRGVEVFNMQRNEINEVLKDICRSFEALAAERGLFIKYDAGNEGITLLFDRDKISQALSNLINNAFKATKKGGITVSCGVDNEMQKVKISIADTGCGIKKEDIDKLFGFFQQIQGDKYEKTGGTGLGLAITREIITAHKGTIAVESKLGEGSVFVIELPLKVL